VRPQQIQAILEDGYNVCWQLWRQHSPANQVAAGMQKDYWLTTDQAAHFVIAEYKNCARCLVCMTIGLIAPAKSPQ
jgi:hypothetical protein